MRRTAINPNLAFQISSNVIVRNGIMRNRVRASAAASSEQTDSQNQPLPQKSLELKGIEHMFMYTKRLQRELQLEARNTIQRVNELVSNIVDDFQRNEFNVDDLIDTRNGASGEDNEISEDLADSSNIPMAIIAPHMDENIWKTQLFENEDNTWAVNKITVTDLNKT